MLISELYEETKDEYLDRLTKTLNIARLGSGRYGHVFQHPTMPNVAVKIFDNDPAYTAYLAWCQKHQSNKYVPKIIGVEKAKLDDLGRKLLRIVFFEKLQKADHVDVQKFVKYALKLVPKDALSKPVEEHEDITHFRRVIWKALASQTTDSDLAEFAKYFVTVFNSWNITPDLHNGNVMLRGNQLVFVDPAS